MGAVDSRPMTPARLAPFAPFALLALLAACSGDDDDAPTRDAGTRAADAGPTPDRDAGPAPDRDAGPADGGAAEAPLGCLRADADGTVDFALRPSVEATVTLTMNGAEPPAATRSERGLFSVTNPVWGSGAALRVQTADGPVVLEGDVIEGAHVAGFVSGACEPPDDVPYCANGRTAVDLAEGANAVDLAYGPLDVTFTLDGAPFADADPNLLGRGDVAFIGSGTNSFTRAFRIGPTGPARVATGAYFDTYDVVFESRFLCESGVLCGGATVGAISVDATSSPQTIDLETALITGHVTKDGGAFVDVGGPPAVIAFRAVGDSTAIGSVRLDANGDYSIRLLRGRYDVEFAGFANGPPPGNPVSQGVVLRDQDLTADRTLDFDVTTADVTLSVTKNGAPFAGTDVGTIVLSNPDGEGAIFLDVPDLVTAWARNVVAERYDARFIAGSDCDPDDDLPCLSTFFARDVDLTTSGAVALDLESHLVTLDVTLAGAPLATQGARGQLTITPTDLTGQLVLALPPSGPTAVQTRLAPGTYAVQYAPPISCVDGALGAMPCGVLDLGTFEVAGATNEVFDIASVHLTGTVTIGETEVPVLPDAAPTLRFTTPDGNGFTATLATSGTYAIDLPPGTFSVAYAPGPLCVGRNVPAPRPCAGQVIHACVP